MWLKPTDRPPTRCPGGGWTLRMLSASTPIVVRVTDDALNEVVPPNTLSASIYPYRDTFYQLADEKFARHELEPDGSITIRSADVRHV
jgi:hypothetical protein